MKPNTIDLKRIGPLGNLATEEGRRSLVEIFLLYFDNVAAACAEMRRAASPEDVRRHAHRAKGASGVVGAFTMADVFADLEARAAAGETIAPHTFDELERQLAELRRNVAEQTGLDLR